MERGELIGLVSNRELRRPGWVDESSGLAHHYELDDQLEVKDKADALVGMLSSVDLLQALNDMIEINKGIGKIKNAS